MKKIIIPFFLLALLLLTACTQNTDKNKQTQEATNKSKQTLVINGIELTVKQNKVSAIKKGKKVKTLYRFNVTGKNISPNKAGLGAIDFVLKTVDGKEIQVDDSLATFGDAIEKGKRIKGEVYFSVDQNTKIKELDYKPGDKVLASWDVKENEK